MIRNALLILLLLAITHAATAQEKKPGTQEKSLVMQGNKLYKQKKYSEAQAAYLQALQKNPAFVPGAFNLGNALIQQKQYDAARKVMANAAKNSKEKEAQGGANYNIGNTYMSEQKWSDAVDAYKQALRRNPQDADAKYNLSYALSKMKQDQNNKDKNKDKNKDPNKDKKDDQQKKDQQDKNKPDNKDGKDKKDQDKSGDQDKQNDDNGGNEKQGDKDGKRPEPQPSKLTQQQADNLLKALQQEERKLQDKKNQGKGVPVKLDKDW